MKMKVFRQIVCAALVLCSPVADAALLRLTADPVVHRETLGGFEVTFEDTGDGLLQFQELVVFSGVEAFGRLWPFLVDVPDIPDFSTLSCPSLPCHGGLPSDWWTFGLQPGLRHLLSSSENYTYSIDVVVHKVPEPGTLSLLAALATIGVLIGVRRPRRLAGQTVRPRS